VANDPTRRDATTDVPLQRAASGWTAAQVPVPNGATVLFDVIYTARGRQFIDNNAGRSFLARPA